MSGDGKEKALGVSETERTLNDPLFTPVTLRTSGGASVGFHTRYDRELREPLMWRQGSQVSTCVARGSALLLSSHGRGI